MYTITYTAFRRVVIRRHILCREGISQMVSNIAMHFVFINNPRVYSSMVKSAYCSSWWPEILFQGILSTSNKYVTLSSKFNGLFCLLQELVLKYTYQTQKKTIPIIKIIKNKSHFKKTFPF